MQELMDSQFDQIVRGIAEARAMEEEHVQRLFDDGPFIGRAAVEADLVDALAYRDEVLDRMYEMVDSSAELVGATSYLERGGRPHRRGTMIALIHGHGSVMPGRSGYSPIDGSVTMGAKTVTAAFRDAIEDSRV
jgi:protease-4